MSECFLDSLFFINIRSRVLGGGVVIGVHEYF